MSCSQQKRPAPELGQLSSMFLAPRLQNALGQGGHGMRLSGRGKTPVNLAALQERKWLSSPFGQFGNAKVTDVAITLDQKWRTWWPRRFNEVQDSKPELCGE